MQVKEKTVPVSSVGADEGQSSSISNDIITDSETDFNSCDEYFSAFNKDWLEEADSSYLKTVTMSELYEQTFSTNLPIVEGVLYPGTYLFAGQSKIGKSFLMLQLAYHVSTGTDLWGFRVKQGTVLYLALEDDYPRLQRRLFHMFGEKSTENLHLATKAKSVGNGLDEQIKAFVQNYKDTRLIIVDVLQRVRDTGSKDYSYASDYEIVSRLKSMTVGMGIALMIVHHTRKQQADDIFDMISGTNGLMGAADGAFIISKDKRTSDSAAVDIVGRDQPDRKLYLRRNRETLTWELEGEENEPWTEPPDPVLEAVSSLFADGKTLWQGTPTELADVLSLDIKPNALSLRLNIEAGRLQKEYGVFYKNSRGHEGRKITLTKA